MTQKLQEFKTVHVDTELNPYAFISSRWFGYALILVICLPSLFFHLSTYPHIWFDEGYKLNAARTLADWGVYGTYTVDGLIPFDTSNSGGPIDAGLTALSFKILGINVKSARIPSALATLLTAFILYEIAFYLYGRKSALFSILFVLAFPILNADTGFLFIGRQMLSETTALFLIFCGLLIWFISWNARRTGLSCLAGILIGLGILSKTQIAIALVPVLFLIGLIRTIREPRQWLLWLAPTLFTVGVFGTWMVIGQKLVSPEIGARNRTILLEMIRTNLITDLFGQNLSRGVLIIVGLMLIAIGYEFWGILRSSGGKLPQTNVEWAKFTLITFLFVSGVWLVFLSLGWARYGYAPLLIALIILGHAFYTLFKRLMHSKRIAEITLLSAMIIAAFVFNVIPLLSKRGQNDVENTISYIDSEIAAQAIIETWEPELTGLTKHDTYSMPSQHDLNVAIYQFSHNEPIQVNYEKARLLRADYAIVGIFSKWTGVYSPEILNRYFNLIAEFGTYHIYKRNPAVSS